MPTAAVAASRYEGTPAASRHGTRKGDDFARLLKGLFPKELSLPLLSPEMSRQANCRKKSLQTALLNSSYFLGHGDDFRNQAPLRTTKQPG